MSFTFQVEDNGIAGWGANVDASAETFTVTATAAPPPSPPQRRRRRRLGDDTVTAGAGADTFHTFDQAGVDRVTDFHVREGDRVLVDAGTRYTLTQVGADTVIDMGAGA